MKVIHYTATQYARQLAICLKSAPPDSRDELGLSHAFDEACSRLGLDPDTFMKAVESTVEVHMVEVPVATTVAGGEA